jgi:CcmD family protein
MRLRLMFRAVTLTAVLLLAGAVPAVVTAQQTPSSQDGFVPVDQLDPKEELPATPLVAAAYGIAWAAVLFYVWSVWRRLNQVERELAEVNRRLQPGARK